MHNHLVFAQMHRRRTPYKFRGSFNLGNFAFEEIETVLIKRRRYVLCPKKLEISVRFTGSGIWLGKAWHISSGPFTKLKNLRSAMQLPDDDGSIPKAVTSWSENCWKTATMTSWTSIFSPWLLALSEISTSFPLQRSSSRSKEITVIYCYQKRSISQRRTSIVLGLFSPFFRILKRNLRCDLMWNDESKMAMKLRQKLP